MQILQASFFLVAFRFAVSQCAVGETLHGNAEHARRLLTPDGIWTRLQPVFDKAATSEVVLESRILPVCNNTKKPASLQKNTRQTNSTNILRAVLSQFERFSRRTAKPAELITSSTKLGNANFLPVGFSDDADLRISQRKNWSNISHRTEVSSVRKTSKTAEPLLPLVVQLPTPLEKCVFPICSGAPFDKLLSFGEHVLALRDTEVYKIHESGFPVSIGSKEWDPALDEISATLNMRGFYYVFQGDEFFKFTSNFIPVYRHQPRAVVDGFPGVPLPVDGAFKLDDATYIFISGPKFVFYQPDAEPDVSAQLGRHALRAIPGAPSRTDSVFASKKAVYLLRKNLLYELPAGQMRVSRILPVTSLNGTGWIHCKRLFDLCNRRMKEIR